MCFPEATRKSPMSSKHKQRGTVARGMNRERLIKSNGELNDCGLYPKTYSAFCGKGYREGEMDKRETEKLRDKETEIKRFFLLTTLKGKLLKCHVILECL